MSLLLGLPKEVFWAIIEALVRCGLNHALTAKLVCKLFDSEVTRAICTTRLLERDDVRDCKVGRPLATEYLVARTLANDVPSTLCPSHAILGAVDEMCARNSELQEQREHFIRTLAQASLNCWLASSLDWRHSDTDCIIIGSDVLQLPKRTRLENLFAASARLGMKSLFMELWESGVPLSNTFFGNPLTSAMYGGHTDIASGLLRKSSTARNILYDFHTLDQPTIHADTCLSRDMLRLLLDPEVSKDAPCDFYRKLLAHAAFRGDSDLLQYCFTRAAAEGHHDKICCPHQNHGGFRHSKTFAQKWVLLFAVQGGHIDLISSLIADGVDVNARWYWLPYQRPLQAAVTQGRRDVAQILVDHGATDPRHDICDAPALGEAARYGFVDLIDMLLQEGFDIDLPQIRTKFSPAVIAACHGQASALRLLLDRGANLDLGSLEVALDCAARHGQIAIHDTLLNHSNRTLCADVS